MPFLRGFITRGFITRRLEEELIEVGDTNHIFTNPTHRLTEGYITGSGNIYDGGNVTVDDIVAVIEEEATEDMYVMAATSSE